MTRHTVLALVLAGGQGGRMETLTLKRAKPALPFAGVYRLIDFSLSNLRNSDIDDVWLIVQYETQSIIESVAGGRPWDLDRTRGGLRVVPPQQDANDDGAWHEGNADAIYQNRDLIRAADPDLLLVLSADHVYKLDYNDVIDRHLASGAEATLVTTEVPLEQASNHAVVEVDAEGTVTGFAYKPEHPKSRIVATEIFVYDTDVVIDTLEQLAAAKNDAEGSGLEDFGHELLPALVERGVVQDFRLPGYWKDVGRPETYFQAHMDLLRASDRRARQDLHLDDPDWPILTRDVQRMPAHIAGSARIDGSLIAPGSRVAGKVTRSVIGPGVVIEAEAHVRDSILLHDVVVKTGATVRYAIVDDGVTIGAGAKVGGTPKGDLPTTDELTLVGAGARIAKDAVVARGDRIGPGGRRSRKKAE
jgi:glucose-1-phosphate adenylyltransferase